MNNKRIDGFKTPRQTFIERNNNCLKFLHQTKDKRQIEKRIRQPRKWTGPIIHPASRSIIDRLLDACIFRGVATRVDWAPSTQSSQ